MRQADMKTDGTVYAWQEVTEWARDRQGRRVVILATGRRRMVSSGWRSAPGDVKDGVLVRFVDGDVPHGVTKVDPDKKLPRSDRQRFVGVRYAKLPEDQAIVRSAEIVEPWDDHVERIEDIRRRKEQRDRVRAEIRDRTDRRIVILTELIGSGRYTVSAGFSRGIAYGQIKLDPSAVDAIPALLEAVWMEGFRAGASHDFDEPELETEWLESDTCRKLARWDV